MNRYIEDDWNRAVAADPRIAELADAACDVLRAAGPGWYAAHAYGDVRQYLERLVGFYNNQPMPDGSRTQIPGAHERFVAIASRPVTIDAGEAEFLDGSRAYDVTHDVIFGRLCEVEERAN